MKKAIILLVTLTMIMTLFAGCKKAEEPKTPTTGGWTIDETAELPAEIKEAFEKATATLLGVDYTPIACMGHQLVNGTNYAILAEAKVVSPDAQPYLVMVYVYVTLDGEASVLDIAPISVGAPFNMETAPTLVSQLTAQDPAGAVLGGWTVAPEKATKDNAAFAASDLAGKGYVPTWCLASQVVSGTNYCFLMEKDGQASFVYLYQDLSGNVSVTYELAFDMVSLPAQD